MGGYVRILWNIVGAGIEDTIATMEGNSVGAGNQGIVGEGQQLNIV